MRRNPFKPDDGAPWCHKCRAHNPCYVYQILQFAGETVRNEYYCRVCKEQIMRRVGWRVLSTFSCMLAIFIGLGLLMIYVLSESPMRKMTSCFMDCRSWQSPAGRRSSAVFVCGL